MLPELEQLITLQQLENSSIDARAKIEAGADGFFTQPYFDLRLLEVWADLLPDVPTYWGVTPVLADSTRRYWERRNAAFLPRDFAPTIESRT